MKNFKKRVIAMISSIPNIEDKEINPSVFSDNIEKHDCDNCPASKRNQGDTYDRNVCIECWTDAISNYA